MGEKNRSLIRSFKSLFGEGNCLQWKFPKIGREIELGFEHHSVSVIAPNPLRLLEVLDGILLVLAGKSEVHFAAKPHLACGPMHVLDSVNDLPTLGVRE